MEDSTSHGSTHDKSVAPAAEPVRSRWTPNTEQILILEFIFNSGMVNPPKDETVRIRKRLEKFGSVGDANVFYWFQNRRSRSRRRQQLQIQAGQLLAGEPRIVSNSTSSTSTTSNSSTTTITSTATTCSSIPANDLFSITHQMGFPEIIEQVPICSPPSTASSLHYQSTGLITVFINGIPQEVPRGPIDMRAAFGQDVMLVHSSGELIPVNEYGTLYQGLDVGESYFLVSRPGHLV